LASKTRPLLLSAGDRGDDDDGESVRGGKRNGNGIRGRREDAEMVWEVVLQIGT
jgi:hypothetical protein